MAEKTHDPTPKRLADARKKGDVPKAPLVAGAIGLVVALAVIPAVVASSARSIATALTALPSTPTDATIDPWRIATPILEAVVPFASALVAVAFAAAVVQGSLTFSPTRLSPDPSRLDPFGGIKNLVDKSRLWGVARGLIVVVVLAFVFGGVVVETLRVGARANGDVGGAMRLVGIYARKVGSGALIVGGMAAVIDVIVARQVWRSRLMMSRDEVMREHKEGEGDPEIKRRREELHHELLAGEAIKAVREATVVVVNPTHLACALRYRGEGDDEAPTLTGKGEGALAARMIEAARVYGVPIVRDVPVARALHALEVGTEIPEALYEAVAEVLRAAWEESESDR